MPLNIKNEVTHRAARELAELTGTSISEAVAEAISEKLAEERARRGQTRRRTEELLNELSRECAALPVRDSRSADEILGYNEDGLPS